VGFASVNPSYEPASPVLRRLDVHSADERAIIAELDTVIAAETAGA
jgi:hypothetical protein